MMPHPARQCTLVITRSNATSTTRNSESTYMRNSNERKQTGQGIVALLLLIAVFIILPLGCYAFELGKVQLTRMELRTATDAAGLAAAASLAGQSNLNQMAAHQNARDCALNFRQPHIRFAAHTRCQ
jgi:uncharacterized protein HemX